MFWIQQPKIIQESCETNLNVLLLIIWLTVKLISATNFLFLVKYQIQRNLSKHSIWFLTDICSEFLGVSITFVACTNITWHTHYNYGKIWDGQDWYWHKDTLNLVQSPVMYKFCCILLYFVYFVAYKITQLIHKSHFINNLNCTNLFQVRSTSHSSAITE